MREIVAKLTLGEDLTGYLSKAVEIGYIPRASRGPQTKRRMDLDLLLNDWNVHHLHLSPQERPNEFVARSGPLLFATIMPSEAFLLDVFEHGDWTISRLTTLLASEWPSARLFVKLNGILPGQPYSDADRKTLREGHIASVVQVNDASFVPVGGLTTAGTSLKAGMAMDQLLRNVRWAQEQITADPQFFARHMRQKGVKPPKKLNLEFGFFPGNAYGIWEAGSRFALILGECHP